MIEGLKVTVKGSELRSLCVARASYHRERARVYSEQAANFTAAMVEGMNYSGGDPKRALLDKLAQHEAEAGEMSFIAEHIQLTEDYQLGSADLFKLGISQRGW